MSIADEITKAEDMNDLPTTNIMLTGPSGAGKTTFLATMIGPSLLINIDNRAESLRGFKGIDIIDCYEKSDQATAWMRLVRIQQWLTSLARKDNLPYANVMLDSATSGYAIAMNFALTLDTKYGLGGAPAQQHYLPQMYNFMKTLGKLLALPCNTIMTAHEQLEKNEMSGELIYLPMATGKNRQELPKAFNEVYYLWRKPNQDGSYSFFANTQGEVKRDYLHSSLNQGGTFWKDPVSLTYDFLPFFKGDEQKPQGFTKLLLLRYGSDHIRNLTERWTKEVTDDKPKVSPKITGEGQ